MKTLQEINNILNAQIDRELQSLYTLQLQENTAIMPLEKLKRALGREIEYLHLQLKVIDKALHQSESIDFAAINAYYQENLLAIKNEFLVNEQDFLKRMPYSYEEGIFIDLKNPENFKLLLEKYTDVIDDEFGAMLSFSLTKGINLIIYKQHLQKLTACIKQQAIRLQDIKTDIAQQLDDKQREKSRHIKYFEEIKTKELKRVEQSFPLLCAGGSVATLKKMLEAIPKKERVAYINIVRVDGKNGLHFACQEQQLEVVKLLISEEIDTMIKSEEGYCPVHYAVWRESENTIPLLELLKKSHPHSIFMKGIYDRTAVHTATIFGNFTAVKWLVENKLFFDSKENGGPGGTPLHNAASTGRFDIALYLYQNHAHPFTRNANGETPLYVAALLGRVGVLYRFLDEGIYLSREDIEKLLRVSERRPEMQRAILAGIKAPLEDFLHALPQIYEEPKKESQDKFLLAPRGEISFFKSQEALDRSEEQKKEESPLKERNPQ